MAIKQVHKYIRRKNFIKPHKEEIKEEKVVEKKKNNAKKSKENMNIEEIERAETIAQQLDAPKQVKVVKKDRGLIERTESSKIVLTEDNRQVLND